jgi:hypothetical protein
MESQGARRHPETVRFARVEMVVPRIALGESSAFDVVVFVFGGGSDGWGSDETAQERFVRCVDDRRGNLRIADGRHMSAAEGNQRCRSGV